MTSYANLRSLNSLSRAAVSARAVTSRRRGPDGADLVTRVTITNRSAAPTVALFLRADVLRGTRRGAVLAGDGELQSSTWNDNDITLWPGQSQTLTVSYDSAGLRGASPVISLSGWNAAAATIAAPVP
jgi:exo-1,4-beta-D-glucosaminidase